MIKDGFSVKIVRGKKSFHGEMVDLMLMAFLYDFIKQKA